MTLSRPVSPKRYFPQNSVLFSMDSSAGNVFFLVDFPVFGRNIPLLLILETLFFLCSFLLGLPFEFVYFTMQKTVVFIDIPPNRIQH